MIFGVAFNRWWTLFLLACSLVMLVACAFWGELALWQDDSLQRVRQAGVLRVGYAIRAPYAFIAPDGQVTGESVEAARQIAAAAGLPPLQWVLTDFNQLIPGLQARRFDMVAAGLFRTPERARRVLFSQASLCVRRGWLVLKGNPAQLGSYARVMQQHGFRIAAQGGGLEAQTLAPRGELLEVPDVQAGRQAVLQGLVSGLALSWPAVRELARDPLQRLEAVPAVDEPQAKSPQTCTPDALHAAFAFNLEDRALQSHWNRAMEAYLGTERHLQMLARFGLSAQDLPLSPGAGPARRPLPP